MKYDNKALLDSLKKFNNDTMLNVRYNIQLLQYKIVCNNTSDTAIKNEVINRLIDDISDQDLLIRQNAIKNLLTFSYVDFDKKSINSLNKIIKDSNLTRDLILLIGTANIQEQKKISPFKCKKLSIK